MGKSKFRTRPQSAKKGQGLVPVPPAAATAAPSVASAATAEAVRRQLDRMSRDPFKDVLAHFLANHPSPQAIQSFADDHPDRWAGSVANLARISGYHDKLQIDISGVWARLSTMSDAELEQELLKAEKDAEGVYVVEPPEPAAPKEQADATEV